MSNFTERKAKTVAQAEDAMERSWLRFQEALAVFETEERLMLERTDQFVPRSYREARDEAAKAKKWYDSRVSMFHSAQAEQAASTLWED